MIATAVPRALMARGVSRTGTGDHFPIVEGRCRQVVPRASSPALAAALPLAAAPPPEQQAMQRQQQAEPSVTQQGVYTDDFAGSKVWCAVPPNEDCDGSSAKWNLPGFARCNLLASEAPAVPSAS